MTAPGDQLDLYPSSRFDNDLVQFVMDQLERTSASADAVKVLEALDGAGLLVQPRLPDGFDYDPFLTSKPSSDGSATVVWRLWRELQPDHVSYVTHMTIDGEPQSKSRPRFNRKTGNVYSAQGNRQAQELIGWKFRQACPGWKTDASSGFGVMCVFFAATHQRRDVDNMIKLVFDGLNRVAWLDDSQVVEVSGRVKFDREHPRTEVLIYRAPAISRSEGACAQCGKKYRTYASTAARQRFCSQRCGYDFRMRPRTRVCKECSGTFVAAGPASTAVHCSSACRGAASRIRRTCIQCSTAYSIPKSLNKAGLALCSAECRATYWREHRKTAAKGTCATCGGPTSKRSYTNCRACQQSGKSLKIKRGAS